ncbi:MAG: type IV-A pilus assembly ATPase PilB, partial [Desulfatiglandales bacterium]|nr:type IV-A pilus assembly ATPase PilB [Desulfatiglandales bacterium]
PHCKIPSKMNGEYMKELGVDEETLAKACLRVGEGCEKCLDTGYYGRTGIYEMMKMTELIDKTILSTSDANVIKQVAIENGLKTLRHDGTNKVMLGVSTTEEILRVTQV